MPPRIPIDLPDDWRDAITPLYASGFTLTQALREKYSSGEEIFPPEGEVFTALTAVPFSKVRAVIIGQDPYHQPGQAMGLAFAVRRGVPPPPSLRNIFKEYQDDLRFPAPTDTTLGAWTASGILLLNTVLTVAANKAGSHRKIGWEKLTSALIQAVAAKPVPVAFMLLGNDAAKFKPIVDNGRHAVFTAAHPSPLSAHRGFFGSKPFTSINRKLAELGQPPINWELE